ncbi:stage II sporulation protein P [Caldanaerovirga acetigignens]|uniref:Stage II sporulation protein P n=1 Tax=Caldanaerovirga acetigignens TaxID=447595 RepID=A0A1M7FNL4_9FIRM|nr:stage II sporulation protein P [Caldanaerovirga acetigignens]SHM05299.1 stage II sporulation protein P [Caldanaerovirga acetigignens]
MLKVRIIKIRKMILCVITFFLLLAATSGFAFIKKSVTVIGSMEKRKGLEIVDNLDSMFFQKIFLLTIPAARASMPQPKEFFFGFKEALFKFPQYKMNFDVFEPKNYLALQIPLMDVMEIEPATTPGIELPSETVENEHNPPEGPPPAPPEEEDIEIERITPAAGKPIVLIYHTHTTESYMPSTAYNYQPRDQAFHTNDLRFTVVRVGEVLSSELNKLGVTVLHDKTVHDVPTYMYSYSNSLKTLEKVLKENPSIQVVLDIHRDAPVSDPQKAREMTTVKIENKYYSRIMFVVGTDKTFPHPHWKENYKFALLLQKKLEELYPGITREIDLRQERFNQHVSKKALLVEIGSHGNTMEESMESARVLAKALSEVLKDLNKP